MGRRFLRRVLCAAAIAPIARGQTLKISVSDRATKQGVANTTVVLRDSSQAALQTQVTDADGIATFRLTSGGSYWVTAKKIGFLPAPTKTLSLQKNERVTIGLIMNPIPVRLDSIVTNAQKGFEKLTSGEQFFRKHVELGKGHFFLGPEIKASKMSLSEYLVSKIDSLTFVLISPKPLRGDPGRPVIPAGGSRFLAGNYGSHCLYGRIDRFDIYALLLQNDKADIDALLGVDQVVGVEMFASYQDVPGEWRMDAASPERIEYVSVMNNYFTIGRVGMGSRVDSTGEFRPPPAGPGPLLTCPFLQIWTNLAW